MVSVLQCGHERTGIISKQDGTGDRSTPVREPTCWAVGKPFFTARGGRQRGDRMSEDITFCMTDCDNTMCYRHPSHIGHPEVPHSYADFNCEGRMKKDEN